jgi:putative N6-adenine-specific DNA methylase/tRNA (guanine6-N2)-methyltransferase
MTQLRFTTNPGIEDLVEQELRDRATVTGCEMTKIEQKPFNLDGQVLVESFDPRLYETVFQLRSVFHVMRQIHQFSKSPGIDFLEQVYQELLTLEIPEMEVAKEFRVTTKRSGRHLFKSMDVQRLAGAALVEHYGKAVNLHHYDVNVRVDIFNQLCLVSVQLTEESLDRRQIKVWQPRISLKTTMAYGMLRLCQLEGKGRLLDPFCGSGTILMEAATLFPDLEIYGSDRREEAVRGTQTNLTTAGFSHRVQIQQLDARDLEEGYPPAYFRAIVTNPPYGMHLGPQIDFYRLYLKFLSGAEKILEPGGRIVVLVGKGRGAFKKIIAKLGTFKIIQERLVETGDIYPHLFICDRALDSDQ